MRLIKTETHPLRKFQADKIRRVKIHFSNTNTKIVGAARHDAQLTDWELIRLVDAREISGLTRNTQRF